MAEISAPEMRRSSGPFAAADLFTLVWKNLVEVLGTAATATLIRRAATRVAVMTPEAAIEVVEPDDRELALLLRELTGPVVIRRLERIAPLREAGLSFGEEQHER